MGGSPPLMRGKLEYSSLYSSRIRITPAHAGKTLNVFFRHRLRQDHPRSCGENPTEMLNFRGQSSSSFPISFNFS